MKEKYFIHLLDTPVGKYIYDVNTNNIIETREETFEYLKCEGADKILDYYRASKGAFLCIQKNKRILHYGYIIKQSL